MVARAQEIQPTLMMERMPLKTKAFLVRREQRKEDRQSRVMEDRQPKWEILWKDFMKYGYREIMMSMYRVEQVRISRYRQNFGVRSSEHWIRPWWGCYYGWVSQERVQDRWFYLLRAQEFYITSCLILYTYTMEQTPPSSTNPQTPKKYFHTKLTYTETPVITTMAPKVPASPYCVTFSTNFLYIMI